MSNQTKIELPLTGLSCASCVGRAERALAAVPGITQVGVNLATNKASFTTEGGTLEPALAALDKAGYPAVLSDSRLSVDGMTCASCVGRVERTLTRIPGVVSASVNLATHTASVRHVPSVTAQDLAQAVTKAGYATTAQGADNAQPHHDDARDMRRRFFVAAALTLPVFILEMGGHLYPPFHHWLHGLIGTGPLWVVQFFLTLAVLVWPGRVFFAHGIPALLRGAPEMNSLVAMGAGAAFLYSTVATFSPSLLPDSAQQVYFEAAAVIVTLILFGRWLEARARGQASAAIRRLIELAPDTARVERDGTIQTLPVSQIVPGDILHLAAGERVAVDGTITQGMGRIDESMLTGEPVPVAKTPGDDVTAGTVNGPTALVFRVTATGADTALAHIVRLVEDAQATKLPVQAMVDRVTRVFVPVVIGLAVLTFGLWILLGPEPRFSHALVAAISVLIIACPCAMGLAVPVSIMVGTGRGAELGILFRRGDALQRLADARVVGFDKTGTLTEGHPSLTALEPASGWDADQTLCLAASAEARSSHPLAQAVVAAARDRGLTLAAADDVREIAGRGLTATVQGRALILGNAAALTETGIHPDPVLIARADNLSGQSATPIHLAVDGVHAAVMGLSDAVHPGAAHAISSLSKMGVKTVMLTGDVQRTADAVGAQLGIGQIVAGLLPEGKLTAIRDMGRGSVFVGDGINDAPALAAADTGIAIGSGTDVAIEAAEVVLASGDPQSVPKAIGLSRAVMRNIRQNLFWAFAYNVALIPVAMGVLIPFGGPQLSPMLGAAAMALSSVFVVTNALRLRRWER